jgi:glycosyltransferase involved in cell wall biosynthesis
MMFKLVTNRLVNVRTWTRGVDREQFQFKEQPGNYLLYVGRVSIEKNLEDFFALDGYKVVVGDGPMLEQYRKEHGHRNDLQFRGALKGQELVDAFAGAKCFVFPSKTDTFGLVMIEAMSCGTPVAAYPVQGPIDVVEPNLTGVLSEDLQDAVNRAILLPRGLVHKYSEIWSWDNCATQFLNNTKVNYD